MSKISKSVIIFSSVVIGCLLVLYFYMTYYYSHPSKYIEIDGQTVAASINEKCFLYGTNINGVYCSGMTVSQANEQLSKKYEDFSGSIIFEGKTKSISADDVNYTYDFTDKLLEVINGQNALLWPKLALYGNDYITIEPSISYDEAMVEDVLNDIGIVEGKKLSGSLYIELTDEGYALVDPNEPVLKADAARQYVLEEFSKGNFVVSVGDEFYTQHEYTDSEKELMDYFSQIDAVQNRYVAYIFGKEKKTVSKRDWAELINTEDLVKRINCGLKGSEKLSFEIDEDKAVEFIDEFLDEYNTLNNKYFKTHSGAVVYVQKGIYGNKIDVAREEKWFREFVNSGETRATRTPVYLHEAKYKEKNDFGNTYVEISLDEQHMWYYVDGKVFVETDITSGGPAVGGTYPRVCYIQNKIPKKWLNGPTWHVFVEYWMAIDGSIGIHDSSWREVYGGTEYKTNGSHGCINTPFEAMKKIYDNIEVGTPVIVYSVDKNGVDKKL